MGKHDCIILYNPANISQFEGSDEKIYPANVLREEIGAIEESLRGGGFSPYVLAADQFSKELVQTLARHAPKFVFNLCEEINGNSELEMCVAGLLELMGIPYTGSGPVALGLALNKFRAKQLLRSAGVPTPRGFLSSPGMFKPPRATRLPVLVKPVHEDASLGINSSSVCRDWKSAERQAAYVHEYYAQEALVEEYIEGREFNVTVFGQEPQVLAISEIDFSGLPPDEPHIVTYRAKWDEESPHFSGTKPICPAPLSEHYARRIRRIALLSHRVVGCRDYARVDMRMDARGRCYVLEVNPNPDISPVAGVARAARIAGYSYSDFVLRIAQFALERGARVPATVYAL
jgi:D-alanine-D-alanine ligase